jgi:putative endonuclease
LFGRSWSLARLFGKPQTLGARGERLAAKTLKAAGCRILARNYRCPAGEADLVALKGDMLIFAEVKTRTSDFFTDPESAVDRRKQEKYRRVAQYYLSHIQRDDLSTRFDIVAIVIPPGEKPQVRHLADAFH